MHRIQAYQEVNLDETWEGVGKAEAKEYFAVVVQYVVNIGHRLAHRIVLQEILENVYFLLVFSIEINISHNQKWGGE